MTSYIQTSKRAEVKENLPPGVWQDEADEGTWERGEFICKIVRSPSGVWCGYVGVPSTHSAYKKDYSDLFLKFGTSVHGGLTYSGSKVGASGESIEGYWWFGFDCGHFGDVIPTLTLRILSNTNASSAYRTQDYAIEQTTNLAIELEKIDTIDNSQQKVFNKRIKVTIERSRETIGGHVKIDFHIDVGEWTTSSSAPDIAIERAVAQILSYSAGVRIEGDNHLEIDPRNDSSFRLRFWEKFDDPSNLTPVDIRDFILEFLTECAERYPVFKSKQEVSFEV